MTYTWPIVIYLPFPPSVNSYYVHTRKGVRIGPKGLAYKERVYQMAVEQGLAELHVDEKIQLSVILFPPDLRKRDMDNYGKCLLDSITNSNIWLDDSQIDQYHVFRGAKVQDGSAVVVIDQAGPVIPAGKENILIDELIGE